MNNLKVDLFFPGIERSSEAERELLIGAGFIHVTGLPMYNINSQERSLVGDDNPDSVQFPRSSWGYNGGKTVIVTSGGEVWIANAPRSSSEKIMHATSILGPNHHDTLPPGTGGYRLNEKDVLDRSGNPDAVPKSLREWFDSQLANFLAEEEEI
jgi:hypothetical protein